MRRNLQREKDGGLATGEDPPDVVGDDEYIPQKEYSQMCNCDFAPIICNDFICDYLDKEHGTC